MPVEPRATGAVFLSYASQDAEAAKRICDVLRTAGVEVWFDTEGGLEHGDEWDAKIRRQIKECVLFLPIISVNTQAREEGYFRIEWELAAQRALGIASGVAFILPIVIDDTKEPSALVPDRFRTVQWTRLRGGELTPEVKARFLKLWSHRAGMVSNETIKPTPLQERTASPARAGQVPKPRAKVYFALATAVFALVAVVGWRLLRRPSPAAPIPVTAAGPVAPSSQPARDWPKDPELKRAITLIEGLESIPDDFALAEQIVKPIVDRAPTDAEAVTVMARVQSHYLKRGFDQTDERAASARRYAERALQLAPDEPEAMYALACYLDSRGTDGPRAERLLRRAMELDPANPRPGRELADMLFGYDRLAEALAQGQENVRRFPADVLSRYDLARLYKDQVRYEDFGRELEATLAIAPLPNAIVWKARLQFGLHNDFAGMKTWLDRVPERVRGTERAVFGYFLYAAFGGQPEAGLAALRGFPQKWFTDFEYAGPTALLNASLLELQGRTELARQQYEAALTEIQKMRATDPGRTNLSNVEFWSLLGLERKEEARASYRQMIEGVRRPYAQSLFTGWWFTAIPASLLLGERTTALALLRESLQTLPESRAAFRLRLRIDPRMAPFRDDAEITALLRDPEPSAQKTEDRVRETEVNVPIDRKSVAVLAFANLSDDKANEYFSDGISEELLNVLAKVPGLKVTARTSSFHFKGKDTAIKDIAQQLGVAYVVEGSVRKQGDKVRITAQLIKAADGFHVWSDTFTRDLKDIFAVQDEIAGLIANSLSLRLGVDRSVGGRVTVPEAFELYLQGRAAWNLRTRDGYARAESMLSRAIDLDPGFARAHSALADVWGIAGYENESGGGTYGWRNSPTVAKVTAKAEQALTLDPNCAEACTTLAFALESGWKWEAAERAYQRAIELNPNYATARHWFGMMLWVQGKIDEALRQLKQATESDPLSHRILDTYARMLNQAGRPDEALVVADRALALQPMAIQAATQKVHALVLLERVNEAVALLEKVWALGLSTEQRTNALLVLQLAGAEAVMRRIIGSTEDLPSSQFKFSSLIALGRADEALAGLRPADLHENQLINMALFRFYDPVREDPRFLQAISDVGYLEDYRRARAWLAANLPKGKK